MSRTSRSARWLLTVTMLAAFFFGAAGQSLARVEAAPPEKVNEPRVQEKSVNPAPPHAVDSLNVVISEFRFLGPEGGNDEFIELFNPSNAPILISGWQIMGSNNVGGTSSRKTLGAVTLQPGQHYLLVQKDASAGLVALADVTYSTGITEDGGIALMDGTTIVDAVGLSAGSDYGEGTPLSPLSGTSEQSYERKTAADSVCNCIDTDNNAADFMWNQNSSNPQNSSSAYIPCITVINVTSDDADKTYVAGEDITVKVVFSVPVNVTGSPTLLLETGATDRTATFPPSGNGNGTNTLKFVYTVQPGDTSSDLDYVSVNALSLNGGSITGASGDATLILPEPGQAGSLGANKDIKVDTITGTPTILSIKRHDPLFTPTKENALTFRVTFSEAVINVHPNDFTVTTTPSTSASVTQTSGSGEVHDVTVSVAPATYIGKIELHLNTRPPLDITDVSGTPLSLTEPAGANYEKYDVDYVVPTITSLTEATGQSDPAGTTPVKFTVEFSEEINVGSFVGGDITQKGTAPFVTWAIADSGDHKKFTLSAYPMGNGTVIPAILADRVTDLAENKNTAFDPAIPGDCTTSTICVTLTDITAPTVTVNQQPIVIQPDPDYTLPIKFDVVFSEPINTSVFTTSDITQDGDALGVTWSIVDSGDHKNFTLSATAATSYGHIMPSIAANRVTDMVGLNNQPSTSTDNNVEYISAPPTFTSTATQIIPPTITPTQVANKTVVITEVGWSGTIYSSDDQWIELYNSSDKPVDMTGWEIRSFSTISANPRSIPFNSSTCKKNENKCIINPGQFFLLERGSDEVISDISADVVYPNSTTIPGSNSTSTKLNAGGEMLLLCSPYNISANNCKPTAPNLNSTVIDYANNFEHGNGTPTPAPTTLNPWPAGKSSPYYYSMERRNLKSNEDTNWFTHPSGVSPRNGDDRNGNLIQGTPGQPNWAYNVTSTPRPTVTPTRTRTPVALPGPVLVINEFLARPGHDWNNDGEVNVYDEFIEVVNAGIVDVNVGQYKLDDYELDANGLEIKNGYTLPSKVLKPGEIAVYYGLQTGIILGDNGDTVRLLKSNNSVADARAYAAIKSLDVSTCRITDAYGDWIPRCFPTPGQRNSLVGKFFPPETGGGSTTVCTVPDSAPKEFFQAECQDSGLDVWNPAYWNSFPGEGGELWLPDWLDKWLVIFQ
jgi:hypothetical protein